MLVWYILLLKLLVIATIAAFIVYMSYAIHFLLEILRHATCTVKNFLSARSITLKGHSGPIRCALWSRDNTRVITGSFDGMVCSWDSCTGKHTTIIENHPYPIQSIACHSNGSIIAASSHNCITYEKSTRLGHLINLLDYQTEGPYTISCSPDENYIAIGTFTGLIYLWHRSSGHQLATLHGHSQGITAITWSNDEKLLFSASYDGSARIWNIATGETMRTLCDTYDNYFMATVIPGSQAHVLEISYDQQHEMIATGSILGTVSFWNAQDGTILERCTDHTGSIQALAFNSNGTLLASASTDHTVRLWDTQEKRCLHVLDNHVEGAHALAFSPNGTTVATADGKGTIYIWDYATGKCIRSLQGHSDQINTLEFNGDGSRLLSSSHDCTARVWTIN